VISRLGEVHVEGGRYFNDKKTLSYWRVPRGEPLRYDEVRRSVDAMNANPDRVVKAVMRPGEDPGTSDIFLKVQDRYPWHGGVSYDNSGTKLLGKERPTFYVRHNNLLGLDDIFLLGGLVGTNYWDGYFQYLLPLTQWGTRLAYGFTHSQTYPKKEFEELGINGIDQSHNVTLYQLIHDSATFRADLHLSFDAKNSRTKIFSATSSRDKLRNASAGAEFISNDATGSWTHSQDFTFGLGLYNDKDNALTSRQAGSSYFIYSVSLGRNQDLPWGLKLSANSQVQLTPQQLPSDEQTFLGGATTVRGYPESDYGADQAILTNIELNIPVFVLPPDWALPGQKKPLKDTIGFFLFYDHGYGRTHDPSEFEKRSFNMQGAGLGFTYKLDNTWSGRIESGWALG
ncbi:MAG: ShlB/FhaC/HecB family hemolysin secretion/activation protein, partial [Candidatus Omnitrophota bacterium]